MDTISYILLKTVIVCITEARAARSLQKFVLSSHQTPCRALQILPFTANSTATSRNYYYMYPASQIAPAVKQVSSSHTTLSTQIRRATPSDRTSSGCNFDSSELFSCSRRQLNMSSTSTPFLYPEQLRRINSYMPDNFSNARHEPDNIPSKFAKSGQERASLLFYQL